MQDPTVPVTLPVVTVERIGREREPVVVIDDFTGQIDELATAGRAASYQLQANFPGLRSPADATYLEPVQPLLQSILARVFGVSQAVIEACDYSVVSIAPDALQTAQRIPHYDDPTGRVLALLHYTQGPESGGTSFYRHRRTGFETMSDARLPAYREALAADEREFGPIAPGYIAGDTERFECIHRVEARGDRAILYRGRTLHSGVIPRAPDPARAPATGRLTINTFFTATG